MIRPAAFSKALRSPAAIAVCIFFVGAAFFLPGLGSVSLFDWDEANFAEASREMIERGNWLQVTIDYQPFYQKPPLFFWLQAMSMKAFGVNEFSARFVNALCGSVTLALLFFIGSRLYSIRFGLLWALAFFGSFLPHCFFKSGIIDPVFNLLIFSSLSIIVMAFLSTGYAFRAGCFMLAGLCAGLAILAKGPVALLVLCLTILIFWALQRFKPVFSLIEAALFIAATAIAASIFFSVETATHGTSFIKNFIAYQIKLFSTGDAGHGRPFYFHFLVILFGCFPASFFAIISFFRRETGTPQQALFGRLVVILFWVVLVLFSIVKTKTVLYSSLTWFPVTFLAARCIEDMVSGRVRFGKPLFWSLAGFSLIVSAAITLFPVLLINKHLIMPLIRDRFAVACLENPVRWSGYEFLLGIGYGAAVLIALVLFTKKRILGGSAALFAASAGCLLLFLFTFSSKIEAYSQGGPIAFYKEHSGGNEYVRALFTSYADLFYGKVRPSDNPAASSKDWLLRGPIDRPVFFAARVTQEKQYDNDTTLHLVKLKSEYGFTYYRRDPPRSGGN